MTVVATGDTGRPVDVLVGGDSRGQGVPRRWKLAALVLVLLGAVGVAGRSLAADRAEQQAEDAAFAVLDQVHVQSALGTVYGIPDGGVDRVLAAEVEVEVEVERSQAMGAKRIAMTGCPPSQVRGGAASTRTGRERRRQCRTSSCCRSAWTDHEEGPAPFAGCRAR